MNGVSLSSLTFCFLLTALLSGQSYIGQLDTILASPRDSHQLEQLSELLVELINAGEVVPDSMFERPLMLARELNDFWTLGLVYSNRGVYYLNTGKFEEGLLAIEKAITYAYKSNQEDLLAIAYATKMQLLMVIGDSEECAELATTRAKVYHDAGQFYYEAEVYQILASLSSSLGDYQLTLRYDSTAIALAEQSGYIDLLVLSYSNAAENLNMLGRPEEGLVMANKSLALAKQHELDFEKGNALSAHAESLIMLGNYDEAFKDYELLKDWEGEASFDWLEINKGLLLQRIGRHDESRELLLGLVESIKANSNSPLELKKAYQMLQTVELSQSQYDTVVWYGKLIKAQQDSLHAVINIRNLLELEEKYKAGEKEVQIQLQEEQLARQRIKLYASIFGFLLALIAGVVFYLLSRRLKKRNLENEQLLAEKETLIGEIHHRVKNNLQVISSLLQLQQRGLDSDDAKGRKALRESQTRVNAMGLIHKKLYQGDEVTTVQMSDYLNDLGETLIRTYLLEGQVDIFYDVEEIILDVDKAIPLGLIVNELITNSLKYAFPVGREGTIEIVLHQEKGQFRLAVIDDGVGVAAAKKHADSTSFGNNLIGLLTKKLKGSVHVLTGQGYGVEIHFAA